ncbi:hypothetical protein B0J13DRAFT_614731 [Dactylonectria estremocensis]|uniref:Uncharacterized protein n=1 Tax=Dactylonectria estremocensis TaxID=1079267 RepID=A0A9P9JHU3_9HYPO|nr:hypothetical protein B0J13DRAFT_614731 [Dactylonectria estremocensis]
MASNDPRFFVISQPLGGKDAQRPQSWLGKFVSFPERPSEKYAPDEIDTEKFISKYLLDPLSDLDAKAVINSIKDKNLQMKLTSLLTLGRASHNENDTQVETPHMVTISLRQHERAFDALMSDPNILQQTKQLLKRSIKAYMIVGVRVIFDGRVVLVTNTETNTSTTVTVPVAEAASAALGCPLPIAPDLVDPSGNFTLKDGRQVNLSHRFDGARIFAVEYRTVTLRTSLKALLRRESLGPTFSSEIPVGGNTGRFGHLLPKQSAIPLDKKDNTDVEDVAIETPTLLTPFVSVADVGDSGIGWEGESVDDGTGAATWIYECPDEDEEWDMI